MKMKKMKRSKSKAKAKQKTENRNLENSRRRCDEGERGLDPTRRISRERGLDQLSLELVC